VKAALLRDLDLLTRTVEDDRTVGAVVIASDVAGRFLSHVDANELEALSDAPGPELGVSQALPLWKVINAALGLGLETVGCASTGNLANAVAAQAARAGLQAWIFIPHDLELGKVIGTAVYGPRLVRVRGTYDDVNRLCSEQIEILAGVVPGGGGTQRLARIVGTARALELVLEGAPVDVHRAAELGLIHRVVPAEALLREAQAAAARLATRLRWRSGKPSAPSTPPQTDRSPPGSTTNSPRS
jgi:enoyl-CoA hydratase/carnithine racemase